MLVKLGGKDSLNFFPWLFFHCAFRVEFIIKAKLHGAVAQKCKFKFNLRKSWIKLDTIAQHEVMIVRMELHLIEHIGKRYWCIILG